MYRFSEVVTMVCLPCPQGLFRKVLIREVTPRELVRMRSDKLASEELAQWREKTIKKVDIGFHWLEIQVVH